jgi:hypothetical protein
MPAMVGEHVQLSFEGNAGRAPVFVLVPSLRLTSAENKIILPLPLAKLYITIQNVKVRTGNCLCRVFCSQQFKFHGLQCKICFYLFEPGP